LGLGKYFPWSTFQEAVAAPKTSGDRHPQRTLWPKPPENPDKLPRFPSPSGKVELECDTLARFGYPALPPPSR